MSTHTSIMSSLLLAIVAISGDTYSQELALTAELLGRWEGTIVGDLRNQDVSWQFDLSETGEIIGFMGPTEFGEPALPMGNLEITGNSISFKIEAQSADYRGAFEAGQISGIWRQDFTHPLNMAKQEFLFATPAQVHDGLVGRWEASINGTEVSLEFQSDKSGAVAGTISVPESGINDKPITSISADNSGSLDLQTEVQRSFVGRLVEGYLLGTYHFRDSSYQATFTRPGQQDVPVALNLSSSVRDKLLGVWSDRIGGTRVTMRFEESGSGTVHGFFAIGRRAEVPILEVESQDINVAITTANGRRIVGEISGNEITGDYHVDGGRTSSATFLKETPEIMQKSE